jgi:hypothetical protein
MENERKKHAELDRNGSADRFHDCQNLSQAVMPAIKRTFLRQIFQSK